MQRLRDPKISPVRKFVFCDGLRYIPINYDLLQPYVEAVTKFLGVIVRRLIHITKILAEDLGLSAKSLIMFLDTSLRLETVKIPPDTGSQ